MLVLSYSTSFCKGITTKQTPKQTGKATLLQTKNLFHSYLLFKSTSAFFTTILENRLPIPLMAVKAYIIFLFPSTLVLEIRRMCWKPLSGTKRDCGSKYEQSKRRMGRELEKRKEKQTKRNQIQEKLAIEIED